MNMAHVRRERVDHERGLDLLALARALPVEERGEHAGADRVRRGRVGEGRRDHGVAGVVDLADGGREPGGRLHDDVVAGPLGPLALAAEGGVVDVDEVRLDRAQRLVVDASAARHVRAGS
jgi:hypothetical protein